jgi:hypothetical protein
MLGYEVLSVAMMSVVVLCVVMPLSVPDFRVQVIEDRSNMFPKTCC